MRKVMLLLVVLGLAGALWAQIHSEEIGNLTLPRARLIIQLCYPGMRPSRSYRWKTDLRLPLMVWIAKAKHTALNGLQNMMERTPQ
jgi:hypothetical protein